MKAKHPFGAFIYPPPVSIFAICESKSMLFAPLPLAIVTKNTTTIIAIIIKIKSTTVCIESSLVISSPHSHDIGKSLNHGYFAKYRHKVVLICGDKTTSALITTITTIAAIKYTIVCIVILSPSPSIYPSTHLTTLSIPLIKNTTTTIAITINVATIIRVSKVSSILLHHPENFC